MESFDTILNNIMSLKKKKKHYEKLLYIKRVLKHDIKI